MKKTILFLMSGLLGVVAVQAQGNNHEPFLQKSFASASVKELQAETSGGNIAVYGQTTGDARVEVYVQGNNGWPDRVSKDEIQHRMSEEYDLQVAMEGNRLVAVAHQKHGWTGGWRHNLSISFRIYVPQGVNSHVSTSGGNIDMKELTGSEDFHTSGGNLNLAQLSGTIVGRTSGGNVDITDSHNEIDLETSGGNMTANHCDGKVHLSTSGGNVELRHVKGTIHASTSGGQVEGMDIGGELNAHTSGGNIDFYDVAANLSASTSGGNIHVKFLSTKYVDLSNSSGDISLQLPQGQGMDLRISGERVHSTSMNNFRGSLDEHHIDGSLNGGGIPVKVDNSGGDVHLSFQ